MNDKTRRARGCATGPGNNVCFGGEHLPDSAPTQKYQAQNLVRRFGLRHDHAAAASHFRLVPPAPPPRPRRIAVRIAASDGCRAPYGRSRPFHLTHDDICDLVAYAEGLEAR